MGVRAWAMDLSPLRSSRDFRIIFWGRVVALLGISLTLVALSIQVYDLTRSSLAVGVVNLIAGTTLLAGTLAGGSLPTGSSAAGSSCSPGGEPP